MKKNPKKLRLNRDTLAILAGAVSAAGEIQLGYQTSCTYACDCPTGCSDEQMCIEDNGAALR